MKKLFIVLSNILFSLFVLTAAEPSKYDFAITGVVRSSIVFQVNIFEDAISFDLDSSLVTYNPSYASMVTGIRIGQYTLVSRTPSIKLCVSHTPLVHSDSSLTENNQINYRLYLITGDGAQNFVSTRGEQLDILGPSISTTVNDTEVISLIDEYMYVTLDEGSDAATEAVCSELESGIYQSTITFSVWVQT